MKNHRLLWLMSVLMFLMLTLVFTHAAKAAFQEQPHLFIDTRSGAEATQTPIAQYPASPTDRETPIERILPPVGDNAAMVLGASLLVLIILGGVMFISGRKQKH